jgi:hypothetical protein
MNKTGFIVVIALVGLTAVASTLAPRPVAAKRTEAWLEDQIPEKIDGFEYVPSEDNPKQSYKMDKMVYDTLNPSGIVSRVYSKGGEQYDVVLVNSDNSDSFHDPRVCFQSQGSELINERGVSVTTSTGEKIPVSFVETKMNGESRLAAYTYKGPAGYNPAPLRLLFDIFKAELSTGKVQEGTFYRIIALSPSTDEEQMKKFTASLLEAVSKQSNGVL